MIRSFAVMAALSLGISGLSVGTAQAGEFRIAFNWSGLKLCTSGRANTVANPAFTVKGLPAGTKFIQFRMVDLDVPNYNHGGGVVAISKDGKIPRGVFKYKSPCPPNGVHTYEWTAIAKTKKGFGGQRLGKAKARRKYPQ